MSLQPAAAAPEDSTRTLSREPSSLLVTRPTLLPKPEHSTVYLSGNGYKIRYRRLSQGDDQGWEGSSSARAVTYCGIKFQ